MCFKTFLKICSSIYYSVPLVSCFEFCDSDRIEIVLETTDSKWGLFYYSLIMIKFNTCFLRNANRVIKSIFTLAYVVLLFDLCAITISILFKSKFMWILLHYLIFFCCLFAIFRKLADRTSNPCILLCYFTLIYNHLKVF